MHRDGLPYAFIDWDTTAPGPRVMDLAHAVWRWAIVSDIDELALDEQVRRARLMCDAYGGCEPTALVDAVLANQDRVIAASVARQDDHSVTCDEFERACARARRDLEHVENLVGVRTDRVVGNASPTHVGVQQCGDGLKVATPHRVEPGDDDGQVVLL